MKYILLLILASGMVVTAYFSAQEKLLLRLDVRKVKLGMDLGQLEKTFGTPSSILRNRITYIFNDSSELMITVRDDIVASARLRYHRPLKIEDPKMRKLTLVQMQMDLHAEVPTWFFAGNPEEGLIYKITDLGEIESLTWVPPFSYTDKQPKHLQALLQDFQSLRSSRL